jgi:CBS domain-containing protein
MVPLDHVTRLDENQTAVDALTALSQDSTGRGLVVANGHLEGLLSLTDLAMALEVRQGPRR